MKNKTTIIAFAFILFAAKGFSQDSARTLNDKPGTPSSLRKPYNGPVQKRHTIHQYTAPNQNINHGATESNKVVEKKQPATVIVPNTTNVLRPQRPVIIKRRPVIVNGTAPNRTPPAAVTNGKSNVSNPIR